jgi:hypothetical protein
MKIEVGTSNKSPYELLHNCYLPSKSTEVHLPVTVGNLDVTSRCYQVHLFFLNCSPGPKVPTRLYFLRIKSVVVQIPKNAGDISTRRFELICCIKILINNHALLMIRTLLNSGFNLWSLELCSADVFTKKTIGCLFELKSAKDTANSELRK